MKHKIVGIFVCMLLIATAVPAVESLTNNAIISTVPNLPPSSMIVSKTERQKLLPLEIAGIDYFETPVSIDGDTAVIGAYRAYIPTWAGSMYVFTRTNKIWRQQDRIFPPDNADDYSFGWSVSISGDTALIGAPQYASGGSPGYTYVFTRTGTRWIQQAKLTASDAADGDFFGQSVSLSGDTALIGAWGDDDNGNWSGSAYVFTRTGTTWTQQAKLIPSDNAAADNFGTSVSLAGDTALIGAPYDDDKGDASGSAYVFTRIGTTWTQQTKLLASDGAQNDQFGISVSLDGDTALIGATYGNGNEADSGSGYVFTRTGSTWTQQQKLLTSDGGTGNKFGYSVSLSDDTALIGAFWDFNDNEPGSAYVFTRSGTTWSQQQKLQVSDKTAWCFGISVSVDGDTALISSFYSGDTYTWSSAYIFTRIGTIWIEQNRLFDLKGADYKSSQAQLEVTMPVSMNTSFYYLIEKLFQRFPNAFPLLKQLMR
jgi:hypothetical protein